MKMQPDSKGIVITVDNEFLRAVYDYNTRTFGMEASSMNWKVGQWPTWFKVKNEDTGNVVEFSKNKPCTYNEEFTGYLYKSKNPEFNVSVEVFND